MQMKTLCIMRAAFQASGAVSRVFTTLVLGLCLTGVGYSSSALATPGYRAQRAGDTEGEALYKRHCSVCHGDRGNGSSKANNNLVPPPRDFSMASSLTRETMLDVVTNGKRDTAMTAWKTHFSAKEIASVVDYIRGRFMLIALDPHISQGRGIYGHFCQVCHGDRGQGVKSSEMDGMPRDLTLPQSQEGLTRERMIASVTKGQHGTVKNGFGEKLSAEHIGAVADYIRQVMLPGLSKSTPVKPDTQADNPGTQSSGSQQQGATLPPATVAANSLSAQADMSLSLPKGLKGNARPGEQFFMANCATCHGKKGDGQGPRAYFINPKPRNFLDDYSRTTLNRPRIFVSITMGRPGTEMPAWDKVLTEQEIANVAEFVFQTFIQPNAGAKASAK